MMNRTKQNEHAVSPVVGVMLMLVVTIIIAAVVSGFAGGLVSGEKKAPSVDIETHIINTGMFTGSGITLAVKSVSEPIPTKDLKLVTSWSTTYKTGVNAGQPLSGGATTIAGTNNTKFYTYAGHTAPYGMGPGVKSYGLWNDAPSFPDSLWGNYSITGGTNLRAYPVGPFVSYIVNSPFGGGYGAPVGGPIVADYTYHNGGSPVTGLWWTGETDSMQGVLGTNWENLRAGEIVNVKLIHIPSGKTIYNANIAVEGA